MTDTTLLSFCICFLNDPATTEIYTGEDPLSVHDALPISGMLNGIKHLWQRNKFLLLAFGFAAIATVFFATRMIVLGIYWADPDHQNQPLEGWMTPRYVAYSYGLEADEFEQVLGIDPTAVSRVHLRDLLKEQDLTLSELQARLDALVAARPTE